MISLRESVTVDGSSGPITFTKGDRIAWENPAGIGGVTLRPPRSAGSTGTVVPSSSLRTV